MTDNDPDDQTPNAVVATYTNEDDVTTAVKHLERKGFDMSKISVLGKCLSEERHIVGFETSSTHTARWAKWGAMWGWLFGALFLVPGVGNVAVGGYLALRPDHHGRRPCRRSTDRRTHRRRHP